MEADRALLDQPWVGASFESCVAEQLIGQLDAMGHRAQPYSLRTHDGHEIGATRRILISRSTQVIESDAGIVCDLPWLLEHAGELAEG